MNRSECRLNVASLFTRSIFQQFLIGVTIFAVMWKNGLFAADEVPASAEDKFTSRIFIANPDGSDPKPLVLIDNCYSQGSPAWSQDGKLIAFDGEIRRPDVPPRKDVFVVNSDGTNPRLLIDGYMPSFSPDGKHILFCRNSKGGIWIMSTEGPDVELTQIDKTGWGVHWSNDGKVLFSTRTGTGANFVIFDLLDGHRELVFDEPSRYQQILWNFKWSPDGKQIVFKGIRRGSKTPEVAIVDGLGQKYGLTTRYEQNVHEDFSWSPDSSRILISQTTAQHKHRQLYFLDPNTTEPPQFLPGQEKDRFHADFAYSPDGKKLAISSGMRIPQENLAPDKAAKTK